MSDKVRRSYRDFDGTRQTTSIAVDSGATPAERATLSAQMNLWSAGSPDGHIDENEITAPDGGSSTNPVAQEAVQVILEMKDAVTGQIYRERIPQAYLDKADDGTPDAAWTTTGQGDQSLTVGNPAHDDYATFKTAIEAVWESPNGNAGTLERTYIEK
jgi:hypothetical protein